MGRVWHKTFPPKLVQKYTGIYKGIWMPQMDRAWESEDGYTVMSRQIETAWGKVEHITIECVRNCDIPWAVKQEIKDELFGNRRIAIEVFPGKKNLIDVCNVYHLWLLPKDFRMPFGIHPLYDRQGVPVERGFDFDMKAVGEWVASPKREEIMGEKDENMSEEMKVFAKERLREMEEKLC